MQPNRVQSCHHICCTQHNLRSLMSPGSGTVLDHPMGMIPKSKQQENPKQLLNKQMHDFIRQISCSYSPNGRMWRGKRLRSQKEGNDRQSWQQQFQICKGRSSLQQGAGWIGLHRGVSAKIGQCLTTPQDICPGISLEMVDGGESEQVCNMEDKHISNSNKPS